MNKLQGLYELKWLGIPTIPWKKFEYDSSLEDDILWSIRMAIPEGDDLNLPRAIGVTANEATKKGREFLQLAGNNGLVIYYPFFVAEKSGIVEIRYNDTIIEAVNEDLWNLTTKGKKDVTIFISKNHQCEFYGNNKFITQREINELLLWSGRVRIKYKDLIFHRSSVMLEWSFAYKSSINKSPLGERYLVFYECRALKF